MVECSSILAEAGMFPFFKPSGAHTIRYLFKLTQLGGNVLQLRPPMLLLVEPRSTLLTAPGIGLACPLSELVSADIREVCWL